jgi:hypothetical protein
VIMERLSRAIEQTPGLLLREVHAVVAEQHAARSRAIEQLVRDGFVDVRQDGPAKRHFSVRPYRASWERGLCELAGTLPTTVARYQRAIAA